MKHLGKQTGLDGSASSLSIPKAYFKPASSMKESICSVTITSGIDAVHEHLKLETGWSDEVVRDFVIRHERSHCIEKAVDILPALKDEV